MDGVLNFILSFHFYFEEATISKRVYFTITLINNKELFDKLYVKIWPKNPKKANKKVHLKPKQSYTPIFVYN